VIAAFVKNVGGNVGLGKGEIIGFDELFIPLGNRNSVAQLAAKRETSPIVMCGTTSSAPLQTEPDEPRGISTSGTKELRS
jgi:hypothetical protein